MDTGHADLAWAAGFFQGEGYVGILKNKRKLKLKLSTGSTITAESCYESWQQYGGTRENYMLLCLLQRNTMNGYMEENVLHFVIKTINIKIMETQEITLAEALKKINELGYKYIRYAYNGAGDSGDIDSPEFYGTADEADYSRIEGVAWKDNFAEQTKRKIQCSAYLEPVYEKVHKILNDIEDWWNNDGGGGSISIDIKTGDYEIDNYVNVISTEEFSHDGNLNENKE